MTRPAVRVLVLVSIVTTVAFAQTRRAVTTADYGRAVRMLAPALNGLVVGGTVARDNMVPDGRFWYVPHDVNHWGERRSSIPVKKTREVVATPPAALATGTGQAAGAAGGRGGRVGGGGGGRGGGRGGVAITKTCGPNVTGMTGALRRRRCRRTARRPIFICHWNLWVRDVATGQERQLTKDGEKDFGYATNNAGWTTSAGHGAVVVAGRQGRRSASSRTNGRSATCTASRRRSMAATRCFARGSIRSPATQKSR